MGLMAVKGIARAEESIHVELDEQLDTEVSSFRMFMEAEYQVRASFRGWTKKEYKKFFEKADKYETVSVQVLGGEDKCFRISGLRVDAYNFSVSAHEENELYVTFSAIDRDVEIDVGWQHKGDFVVTDRDVVVERIAQRY